MSFASDVKKEIATVEVDECCQKAELYQIIRLASILSINNKNLNITFETTSLSTARRIIFLIKNIYGVYVELIKKERYNLDKKPIYILIIEDRGIDILKDLEIIDDEYNRITTYPKKFLDNECCKAAILRASFLTKGSINDPNTNNYHLEITTNNAFEAQVICDILSEIGIDAKTITRPKGEVVYLKKAENIGDLLRFIGATNSLFAFEDLRIKKDLSNYVNRIMNCDVANEQKAIETAAKQLEDIKFLEKNHGFLNLSPRLMNAIILRTSYPEDSLSQLSEKSEEVVGKYISKSGLSHCFKDISLLVEALKK